MYDHKNEIKSLQMDLPPAEYLLQKTSPKQDPATLSELPLEINRQGAMLHSHHQQLEKLARLSEEMGRSLHTLNTSMQTLSTAVCSLLTGQVLEWATALWEGRGMSFTSYTDFQQLFREVFDHAIEGHDPNEEILNLKQGSEWNSPFSSGCSLHSQAGHRSP